VREGGGGEGGMLRERDVWNREKYTVTLMNMKKPNETSSDSGEIDQHIYRHMIASLMYLVNIGPDIGYAVNVLSQFMSQSRKTHSIEAKHVLRY
jgi:hypothetical protein